LFLQGRTNSK
jgi:hypothetical protein